MSDLMFYGVLRMPFSQAMDSSLTQRQFYGRAQEAADRIEAADARIGDLAQELEISQRECGQAVTANAELRERDEALAIEMRADKNVIMAMAEDFGAIHDALGLDPDDAAGAAPIIEAIEALAAARAPAVAEQAYALSDEQIMDFANMNFSLIFEPPEAIQFARDIESHSPAFAVVQPAPPAHEKDLLDIVRSLVCAVDRKAQVGENYPSPTAEGCSLMIAARQACVERGFTAGGLSVDGAAPADAGSAP